MKIKGTRIRFTGQWTASNLLPSSGSITLARSFSSRYPEGILAGDKGFFDCGLHRPLVSRASTTTS